MSKKVSFFVSIVLWIGAIINEVWFGVWAIENGYRNFGLVGITIAIVTAIAGGMWYEAESNVKRLEEAYDDTRRV